eukprot:CAMPEP_0172183546 /NCGR_PEP_ID=MMETSP1050-20130122/19052_1 /TAXON_ID=233186 /ORGANISM="Cryptomonas curvata, Strain CCAP979/52" /LENGTH=119 /DNA_ID=CAMNT_0012857189 /DNA_START=168 /DNA_END=523 /DNA_ORIENTATION=-
MRLKMLDPKDQSFWKDAEREGRSRDPLRSVLNIFNAQFPTSNENSKLARRVPVNRGYNTISERRDAMSVPMETGGGAADPRLDPIAADQRARLQSIAAGDPLDWIKTLDFVDGAAAAAA